MKRDDDVKGDRTKYEARARIAKSLAHPSRLLIVDLLQRREMTVTELTEAVDADQSTVSKHLALLRSAGVVAVRKEGTASFYRVSCGCLDGFFECLERVLACDVQQRERELPSLVDRPSDGCSSPSRKAGRTKRSRKV